MKRTTLKPTESEAEGMREAYDVLVHGALEEEKEFTDPEDDWGQMWLILTPKGRATFMAGDLHKHDMARAVGIYAKKEGAHVVGFTSSSWTLAFEDVPEDERGRIMELHAAGVQIADMPYKREKVMVSLYSASQVRIFSAEIHRTDDKPPTLGPFERFDFQEQHGGQGEISGAMVDPVRAGLLRMG